MQRRFVGAVMITAVALSANLALAQTKGGKSAPLTIVAQLKAKPGKEKELQEVLQALVKPTRREKGLINYDMHVSNEDPGLFLFYENWRTKGEWDTHMKSPHLEAFGKRNDELVAEWKLFQMTRLP